MTVLNHKVAAFSLLEMLVVMVLSSIIVGIIYFAFFTVTVYQKTLENKYQHIEDINFINSGLTNDFDRSDSIVMLNEQEIICYLKHTNTNVQYSFFNSTIYRRQDTRIDSTACTVSGVQMLFRNHTVIKGIIDEVRLETILLEGSATLVFYKPYDAAALIKKNYEQDHGWN